VSGKLACRGLPRDRRERQLAHVLERMGITSEGKLTAQDLAGLPLPERPFE
jgi:hypothetical protein